MPQIKWRVLIPVENGYQELSDFSIEKQREFSDKCTQRIGESFNAESVQALLRAASTLPF